MDFKQYRTNRKLTQTQAGALIGVSGTFWSELENGAFEQSKITAFARVLKHLDHPLINLPLTHERMASVRSFGLNYSEASERIGAGNNTWSNILNGHTAHKKRWVLLCNSLLIDLAENQINLDLLPSGDIEIIQPKVLTLADETDVQEPEISDQALIPFAYGSQAVRCKMVNNDPWWVLRDVCAAIGYNWIGDASALIDKEELEKFHTLTSGGPQMLLYVSESGLYQFLARVQVESAKPFQRWLYKEVLPSIRKTGGYQAQPQLELNNPLSHLAAIGQAFQTIAEQMRIQEQKIANLEQAAQQVKYLEIAKTDRSEVLEILQTELVEQKAKDRIEQLNHYRQRKELEKRVSDVAWLAVKAHGGDHGDIIKDTNKRIKMAIRGAHGYAIGRERYQDQDFIMAYQVVAMIEKEIGDYPKQGEIDFGKDKVSP